MAEIGNIIIYVIMFCTILGAVAAIRDSEGGLGTLARTWASLSRFM